MKPGQSRWMSSSCSAAPWRAVQQHAPAVVHQPATAAVGCCWCARHSSCCICRVVPHGTIMCMIHNWPCLKPVGLFCCCRLVLPQVQVAAACMGPRNAAHTSHQYHTLFHTDQHKHGVRRPVRRRRGRGCAAGTIEWFVAFCGVQCD